VRAARLRNSGRCDWIPQARAFARRGYQVLAFDSADFGDSQPGPADARVDTDVVAAAEQLRRHGAERIVLVGSSMGGTAVLSAATRIRPPGRRRGEPVRAVELRRVDAEAAMTRLRVPVLFVAGHTEPF
jgi:alpha-beta hydrolase superfamily lysophospholipase